MLAAAAVITAGMSCTVVIVMIAAHVGVIVKLTAQQCLHRCIRITANTAVNSADPVIAPARPPVWSRWLSPPELQPISSDKRIGPGIKIMP